jgi:hypothetical protein
MSKVGMIDTRKFVSLVITAALIIATVMAMIVPRVARAAEDTVSGSFEVNDGSFNVDNVTIWSMAPAEVTEMSPHTDFHVKVDITNTSGLDKLSEVKVILFYESDGAYTAGDEVGSDAAADHATFKWTPGSGGLFEIVGPLTTKWNCSDAGSIQPSSLLVTEDAFEFHITVGDVATFTATTDHWYAYAIATDVEGTDEFVTGDLTMAWYGAIAAGASVTWAAAAPGTGYTQQDVSVNYIANGDYVKSARASATWTTGAVTADLTDDDTLGANEFALKIDDQNTSEPGVGSRVTSSYEPIGSDYQTDEAGDTDTSGLWLKLGSPFTKGTYTGTVYFQISNT